ncbi:MAG: hypothetical protein ACOCVF_02050 [bacterium]
MIVIYSDNILKVLSIFMKIGGIALFPFIILRKGYKNTERGKIVLNHEKIHIKQQMELLVVIFYVIYILNYIYNVFKYKGVSRAYSNICFEREANAHERDFNYLKNRKLFAWIKY